MRALLAIDSLYGSECLAGYPDLGFGAKINCPVTQYCPVTQCSFRTSELFVAAPGTRMKNGELEGNLLCAFR